LYFSVALVRFFVAAKRKKVDLLHIHLAAGGSAIRKILLARLARTLGIPYVVHLHAGLFARFWSEAGARLTHAIDRFFSESAEIILLGRHWARVVTDHVPDVADKITVLPNATAARQFDQIPSRDGHVRITFLGKINRNKGTDILIEALGRLSARADWSAVIAGEGEIAESRAHASSLRIGGRVELPGWLDPAATVELLRRTDILALPSRFENLPMVILEAFAHGIAVVATPVGAVPEVIEDGRNGLLIPVGDVDALAHALRRLIEDPLMRARLGEAARRDHAERYEIGGYIKRLTQVWWRAGQFARAC
jgi:glycosyltransferase involved in cell wall biosynthesis